MVFTAKFVRSSIVFPFPVVTVKSEQSSIVPIRFRVYINPHIYINSKRRPSTFTPSTISNTARQRQDPSTKRSYMTVCTRQLAYVYPIVPPWGTQSAMSDPSEQVSIFPFPVFSHSRPRPLPSPSSPHQLFVHRGVRRYKMTDMPLSGIPK